MPYMLAAVIIAIAVVLGIFTGVWGGIVWLFIAGLVAGALFLAKARNTGLERTDTEPTGVPRSSPGGAETANQRVGQS